ncbi:hypothetical protein BKA70DRAFT_451415 [Coprinopsis sp. MPI-PUGE-AT-0042]|nr:hypothetical protein BKA70DRAFT_451415 [Coprinopsis sp. MPI-PUGE-AT-0042]
MKFSHLLSSLVALAPALVSGVRVPGADTPLFYLVATGPDSAGVNFLPVRLHGGSNYFAILTGTGPIAKFFFQSGRLVALDPTNPQGSTNAWRALINTPLTGNGCSTNGQLGTVMGSSSNKCAKYATFGLQSNSENSQLGARLVFDWTGGFYICGTNKEVWYKTSSSDSPSDCTPIELYTLTVVE